MHRDNLYIYNIPLVDTAVQWLKKVEKKTLQETTNIPVIDWEIKFVSVENLLKAK